MSFSFLRKCSVETDLPTNVHVALLVPVCWSLALHTLLHGRAGSFISMYLSAVFSPHSKEDAEVLE